MEKSHCLSQTSQNGGYFYQLSLQMKLYLNVFEDHIKISLNRIWWKSTDKRCKRGFFRKRFRSSISMSSTAATATTATTTPSSSTVRSPIIPNRNRFQAILHLETENETESNSIHILPGAITKTIVKSATPATSTATVEVVRHVGRTVHRP